MINHFTTLTMAEQRGIEPQDSRLVPASNRTPSPSGTLFHLTFYDLFTCTWYCPKGQVEG